MEVFVLVAVFAVILYLIIRLKDRHDDKKIQEQIAEEAEQIQATLPPLQSGALFTAAITPLENNTIQFAVKLSPEARDIIARHNLSSVRLFDFPNPNYEKQKREQARLRESPKRKDHIAASVEPPKNIDITIKDFCHPSGITRSFPSASEAKAWTQQLRQGMNIFENELEANEKPAEASTFTVMRKS